MKFLAFCPQAFFHDSHGRAPSTPGRYKNSVPRVQPSVPVRPIRIARPQPSLSQETWHGAESASGASLSLPPRPDLLSRNNAPASRNPTWREAERSPSLPSHPRCPEKQILPATLRERIRKADVQFLHHALVTVVTVVTGQQAHIRHTPRITQPHTVEIDHECRVVQLLHRTADAVMTGRPSTRGDATDARRLSVKTAFKRNVTPSASGRRAH